MNTVGFTTTIPLEILVAAGKIPVDLNNVFITDPRSMELVEEAELAGFPRNTCGWIKGIYAVIKERGIKEMIAVTEGDCSYTKALMEVLSLHGVSVTPFAYPHDRNAESLRREIEKLACRFSVSPDQVRQAKIRLDRIRAKVREIDRLTWQEDLVSGQENHYFQVATSDMNSDPERFDAEVDDFLDHVRSRRRYRISSALPISASSYVLRHLCIHGVTWGTVVFNETQRQFAMPYGLTDIVEQYRAYTYPYDIFHRLADIIPELAKRRVDGVIHYVQSFCFRQIEDIIIRAKLPVPILTLEGDKATALDARTKIRIEGFLEMLADA